VRKKTLIAVDCHTSSSAKSTSDLRGFLPPCETEEPPLLSVAQGTDNEAVPQKDRKGGVPYCR
jgi:hypothetical protein